MEDGEGHPPSLPSSILHSPFSPLRPMSDHELKIKITTLGDPSGAQQVTEAVQEAAGAQRDESALTEAAIEKTRALNAEQSALKDSLRELGQELRDVGSAVHAAIDPLLSGLQRSGELLADLKTKLDALGTAQAGAGNSAPARHFAHAGEQMTATAARHADTAPAEPASDGASPPAGVEPGGTQKFAELARQLDLVRQNEQADQAALLKALQDYNSVTGANTQQLIDQVRSAVAQQRQLQVQIEALKSAQQQQAGQNANRNLNTGN